MDEYLFFADESKPTSNSPYFSFAGISVKRKYYEDVLVKEVNKLKTQYFNRTDIIFHFTDMKKNRKDFSILRDEKIRNAFWDDYVKLIDNAQMDVLGVYFNEKNMKHLYSGCAKSNYDIAFYLLLDNYAHYLNSKNAYGQICIESRTFKENSYLQRTFFDYITNGSVYFSKDITNNYLTSLGFIVKGDNCIGLQIADVVPQQMIRYVNNYKKDFHKLSATLKNKIYHCGTEYEHIVGFRDIL